MAGGQQTINTGYMITVTAQNVDEVSKLAKNLQEYQAALAALQNKTVTINFQTTGSERDLSRLDYLAGATGGTRKARAPRATGGGGAAAGGTEVNLGQLPEKINGLMSKLDELIVVLRNGGGNPVDNTTTKEVAKTAQELTRQRLAMATLHRSMEREASRVKRDIDAMVTTAEAFGRDSGRGAGDVASAGLGEGGGIDYERATELGRTRKKIIAAANKTKKFARGTDRPSPELESAVDKALESMLGSMSAEQMDRITATVTTRLAGGRKAKKLTAGEIKEADQFLDQLATKLESTGQTPELLKLIKGSSRRTRATREGSTTKVQLDLGPAAAKVDALAKTFASIAGPLERIAGLPWEQMAAAFEALNTGERVPDHQASVLGREGAKARARQDAQDRKDDLIFQRSENLRRQGVNYDFRERQYTQRKLRGIVNREAQQVRDANKQVADIMVKEGLETDSPAYHAAVRRAETKAARFATKKAKADEYLTGFDLDANVRNTLAQNRLVPLDIGKIAEQLGVDQSVVQKGLRAETQQELVRLERRLTRPAFGANVHGQRPGSGGFAQGRQGELRVPREPGEVLERGLAALTQRITRRVVRAPKTDPIYANAAATLGGSLDPGRATQEERRFAELLGGAVADREAVFQKNRVRQFAGQERGRARLLSLGREIEVLEKSGLPEEEVRPQIEALQKKRAQVARGLSESKTALDKARGPSQDEILQKFSAALTPGTGFATEFGTIQTLAKQGLKTQVKRRVTLMLKGLGLAPGKTFDELREYVLQNLDQIPQIAQAQQTRRAAQGRQDTYSDTIMNQLLAALKGRPGGAAFVDQLPKGEQQAFRALLELAKSPEALKTELQKARTRLVQLEGRPVAGSPEQRQKELRELEAAQQEVTKLEGQLKTSERVQDALAELDYEGGGRSGRRPAKTRREFREREALRTGGRREVLRSFEEPLNVLERLERARTELLQIDEDLTIARRTAQTYPTLENAQRLQALEARRTAAGRPLILSTGGTTENLASHLLAPEGLPAALIGRISGARNLFSDIIREAPQGRSRGTTVENPQRAFANYLLKTLQGDPSEVLTSADTQRLFGGEFGTPSTGAVDLRETLKLYRQNLNALEKSFRQSAAGPEVKAQMAKDIDKIRKELANVTRGIIREFQGNLEAIPASIGGPSAAPAFDFREYYRGLQSAGKDFEAELIRTALPQAFKAGRPIRGAFKSQAHFGEEFLKGFIKTSPFLDSLGLSQVTDLDNANQVLGDLVEKLKPAIDVNKAQRQAQPRRELTTLRIAKLYQQMKSSELSEQKLARGESLTPGGPLSLTQIQRAIKFLQTPASRRTHTLEEEFAGESISQFGQQVPVAQYVGGRSLEQLRTLRRLATASARERYAGRVPILSDTAFELELALDELKLGREFSNPTFRKGLRRDSKTGELQPYNAEELQTSLDRLLKGSRVNQFVAGAQRELQEIEKLLGPAARASTVEQAARDKRLRVLSSALRTSAAAGTSQSLEELERTLELRKDRDYDFTRLDTAKEVFRKDKYGNLIVPGVRGPVIGEPAEKGENTEKRRRALERASNFARAELEEAVRQQRTIESDPTKYSERARSEVAKRAEDARNYENYVRLLQEREAGGPETTRFAPGVQGRLERQAERLRRRIARYAPQQTDDGEYYRFFDARDAAGQSKAKFLEVFEGLFTGDRSGGPMRGIVPENATFGEAMKLFFGKVAQDAKAAGYDITESELLAAASRGAAGGGVGVGGPGGPGNAGDLINNLFNRGPLPVQVVNFADLVGQLGGAKLAAGRPEGTAGTRSIGRSRLPNTEAGIAEAKQVAQDRIDELTGILAPGGVPLDANIEKNREKRAAYQRELEQKQQEIQQLKLRSIDLEQRSLTRNLKVARAQGDTDKAKDLQRQREALQVKAGIVSAGLGAGEVAQEEEAQAKIDAAVKAERQRNRARARLLREAGLVSRGPGIDGRPAPLGTLEGESYLEDSAEFYRATADRAVKQLGKGLNRADSLSERMRQLNERFARTRITNKPTDAVYRRDKERRLETYGQLRDQRALSFEDISEFYNLISGGRLTATDYQVRAQREGRSLNEAEVRDLAQRRVIGENIRPYIGNDVLSKADTFGDKILDLQAKKQQQRNISGLLRTATGGEGITKESQEAARAELERMNLTMETAKTKINELKKARQEGHTQLQREAALLHTASAAQLKHARGWDVLVRAFRNVAVYGTGGMLFFQLTQGLIGAVRQSIELERALARVQGILRSQSASEIQDIRKRVLGLGAQYGVQPQDVLGNVQVFAQAGFEGSKALQAAESSIRGQLGLGFSPEQAQELLIAVNALTNGAITFENILDRISRVESTRAVSAQDLAVSLQRVGALAQQLFGAGYGQQVRNINPVTGEPETSALEVTRLGRFDFADIVLGLTTQIVERTRVTGNQAATGLRFILSRLASPQIAGRLQDRFGIRLAANPEGTTLRPLVAILQEIGQTYRSLRGAGRTAEAAQLLQTVAGARQINLAAAVFSDFDNVMKIAEDSASAFGDTQRRVTLVTETLGQTLARFAASVQLFATNLLSDSGLQGALRIVALGLTKTAEAGSPLGGAVGLAGFGAAASFLSGRAANFLAQRAPTFGRPAGNLLGELGILATAAAPYVAAGALVTQRFRSVQQERERLGLRTSGFGGFLDTVDGFLGGGGPRTLARASRSELEQTDFFKGFRGRVEQAAPGTSVDDIAKIVSDTARSIELDGQTIVQARSQFVAALTQALPGLQGIQSESERTQLALDLLSDSLTFFSATATDQAQRFEALTGEYLQRASDNIQRNALQSQGTGFFDDLTRRFQASSIVRFFGGGNPLAFRARYSAIGGAELNRDVRENLNDVMPGFAGVLRNLSSDEFANAFDEIVNTLKTKGVTLGQALDEFAQQFRLTAAQRGTIAKYEDQARTLLQGTAEFRQLGADDRYRKVRRTALTALETDDPELAARYGRVQALDETIYQSLRGEYGVQNRIDASAGDVTEGVVGGLTADVILFSRYREQLKRLTDEIRDAGGEVSQPLKDLNSFLENAKNQPAFRAAVISGKAKRALREVLVDTVVRAGEELSTIRAFGAVAPRLGLADTRAAETLQAARSQVRNLVGLPFKLTGEQLAAIERAAQVREFGAGVRVIEQQEGPERYEAAGKQLLEFAQTKEQQEEIAQRISVLRAQLSTILENKDIFDNAPSGLRESLAVLLGLSDAGLAAAVTLGRYKELLIQVGQASLETVKQEQKLDITRRSAAKVLDLQSQLAQQTAGPLAQIRERFAEFRGPQAAAAARRQSVLEAGVLERGAIERTRAAAILNISRQTDAVGRFTATEAAEQDAQIALARQDATEQLALNEIELNRVTQQLYESFSLVDGAIRTATSGLEGFLVDLDLNQPIGNIASSIFSPVGRAARQSSFQVFSRNLFGEEGLLRKQLTNFFGISEAERQRGLQLELSELQGQRLALGHSKGLQPLFDMFISAADALVARLERIAGIENEKDAGALRSLRNTNARAERDALGAIKSVPGPTRAMLEAIRGPFVKGKAGPLTPFQEFFVPGSGSGNTDRASIQRLVRGTATAYGIDPNVAEALIRTESSLDPTAFNPGGGGKGAFGLGQLRWPTALGHGYTGTPEGLFDPEVNIGIAMKQFADDLRATGGDPEAAVSRYKAGPQFRSPDGGFVNEELVELYRKQYARVLREQRQSRPARGTSSILPLAPGSLGILPSAQLSTNAILAALDVMKKQQSGFNGLTLGRRKSTVNNEILRQYYDQSPITGAFGQGGLISHAPGRTRLGEPTGVSREGGGRNWLGPGFQPTGRNWLGPGLQPTVPGARAPNVRQTTRREVGFILPWELEADPLPGTLNQITGRVDPSLGTLIPGPSEFPTTDLTKRFTKEQLVEMAYGPRLDPKLLQVLGAAGQLGGTVLGSAVGGKGPGATFGASVGSTVGQATFGKLATKLALDAGTKAIGKFAGGAIGNAVFPVVGGLVGGVVGGFVGKLFGGGNKKPPIYGTLERIERSTRETVTAINSQTNQLLSLDNRIFNAPSTFNVPQYQPLSVGAGGPNTTIVQSTTENNFTITGATDPNAVARAVEKILKDGDRRYGKQANSRG